MGHHHPNPGCLDHGARRQQGPCFAAQSCFYSGEKFSTFINPGALDSRDQSRSRSRTSFVSRLTFLNCQDFLDGRDQLFFFSVEIFKIMIFQSRLWRVKIFVEIVETRRDCRDLSRRMEIFEICRDAVKICREISTLSRPFESENDEKSWRIEKSRRENTKIHALQDRDWDKLSRNAKIFRSWQSSRSRSRFFGLDVDVETKSRYLDRRGLLFDVVEIFSTVETNRDPQG